MYENGNDVHPPKGETLHSWKSIAKYLNRCVRTARRWEENENLPVRRHKHLKNNTVFAYTHELDLWLKGREQPSPTLPNNENFMRRRKTDFSPAQGPAQTQVQAREGTPFWQGVVSWFQ